MSWAALLGLAAGSYAIKAAGYLVLGDRPGIRRWSPVLDLFPPALLAALVVVQTVGVDRASRVDARLPGVIAGPSQPGRRHRSRSCSSSPPA